MKIDRINAEIAKTQDKIGELQNRLNDLRRQKTEAENSEIIAVIRSANISQQELIAFIHAYRDKGAAAESMLENRYEPEEQEDEDYENDKA